MAYKVVQPFWDQHLRQFFDVGDFYPHEGADVPKSWLEHQLAYRSGDGRPILEEVKGRQSKEAVAEAAAE